MKHGITYTILEGPISQPQYCIRLKARWIRHADIPGFHVFKTEEVVSRVLTVHRHQVIEPEPANGHPN